MFEDLQDGKLKRIVRLTQEYLNSRIRHTGLSSGLFYYIYALSENDGVSMQELSRICCVDNAHTTRAIAKLVKMGYAVKEANENDSRSWRVHFTPKCSEIIAEFRNILKDWRAIMLKGLKKEEIAALNGIIDKLYINATEYMEGRDKD